MAERTAKRFEYDEDNCPGHVGMSHNTKVCWRCGTHVDSLRGDSHAQDPAAIDNKIIDGWVAVYPTAGFRGLYPTPEACMKIPANGLKGEEHAIRAVFVSERQLKDKQ